MAGLFGKFFSILSGAPEHSVHESNDSSKRYMSSSDDPVDLSFVKRFTDGGGYFVYCGSKKEIINNLSINLKEFLNIEKTDFDNVTVESEDDNSKRNIWLLPSDKPLGKTKPFVDYQNDATAKDIKLALREGFRSIEHVKRYTTTGMGTDQGKLGNMHALGIIADTADVKMGELGTTTFRPPYTPLTFGTIVGRNVGEYFDVFRSCLLYTSDAADE